MNNNNNYINEKGEFYLLKFLAKILKINVNTKKNMIIMFK